MPPRTSECGFSAHIILINVTGRSGEKKCHGIGIPHSELSVLRLDLPTLNLRL